MKINRAATAKLLDPIHPCLHKIAAEIIGRAENLNADPAGYGEQYNVRIYRDQAEYSPTPLTMVGSSRLHVWVHIGTGKVDPDAPPVEREWLRICIPLVHLTQAPKQHSLYQIRFCCGDGSTIELSDIADVDESASVQEQVAAMNAALAADYVPEPDVMPLNRGYIGITKRSPYTRFKEHLHKARTDSGHLLHKTWSWLLRNPDFCFHPVFQFMGSVATLAEAYDREEFLVGQSTLNPKGLNVIPGGMAGIRIMHELRLLSGDKQVPIDERDRALARLEQHSRKPGSPCSHYRSGHMRRLPDGRVTWVRPCWVKPEIGALAA